MAISDASLLARAEGCLLGQVAGDSLGSLVEFRSAEWIRGRYPQGVRDLQDGGTWGTLAGQPTDDSELALALARSIVASGGYRPDRAWEAYRAWYASGPFDIGGTTAQALGGGRPNPESQANGSLMRVSPLGVWGAAHPEAPDLARADSALTHPHPVCQDACATYVAAIAHAVRQDRGQEPPPTARGAYEAARAAARTPEVADALARAADRPPDNFTRHQGWVLIALQNAFYRLLNAPSLEEGVIETVHSGGDTDTNAAIAGALLGAVHGRGAVPERWQRIILNCRPEKGRPGVRRPRPPQYWPVDVLDLAARLLA